MSFKVKDVYVKVNLSRTNAHALGALLYKLMKSIEQAAKINAIELEQPYHEYVAFWWLWEDEWPDDWFKDRPKYPPSYDKMCFDSSWDEASFLMNSLNEFIEERVERIIYLHKKLDRYYTNPTKAIEEVLNSMYFRTTECIEAFYHFLRRWKRPKDNWGKKYSGGRLIGWNIDYDN